MFDLGAAGRRIPIVPYCYVALEAPDELIGENLGYKAHAFVHPNSLAVGCGDAGRFLPAVLEREEPEEGEPRDVEACTIDPEHSAFFSEVLHEKRGLYHKKPRRKRPE